MADEGEQLAHARDLCAGGDWRGAFEAFEALQAGGDASLSAPDIELLATASYMLGNEEGYLDALEHAHRLNIEAGERLRAARCAFWSGVNLMLRGEQGRAGGWISRAKRLVEAHGEDCVEGGYLLIPEMFGRRAQGDWEGAAETAAQAADVGVGFDDRDLFALATHEHGHILIHLGRVAEGVTRLDEAMVAAVDGELSPIVTGIVYCGVILACQDACELGRAREWTQALGRWCASQPDMVAFTGRCLVHRAEIMHVHGAWSEAMAEARRAERRSVESGNPVAAGEAAYVRGELHRMRGELEQAESAYLEANRSGRVPQPGLALLRLAQGRAETAQAAIARTLEETRAPPVRARLLSAQAEILLERGDVEGAALGCAELERIASGQGSAMLDAMAAAARGATELALERPPAALVALRRAWQAWQALQAPYEAARVRALIGIACRELGDEDAARLELEAARATFDELGAVVEAERAAALGGGSASVKGLTARELEVLRHVAAGSSNRDIATALVISEHTVARHLQNIFAKLGVSSRTAATSFAYEHGLV